MIKHIVTWNVMEEVQDKMGTMLKVKELLESLVDEVPGIISIKVVINEMGSSNRDLALISAFDTEEALNAYQVSEGHISAGNYIRSVLTDRACIDYKE